MPAIYGLLNATQWTVLGAFVGLLSSPTISNYFGARRQRADERKRIHATIQLLKAEFGHVSRHNATNLRRITELYRLQYTPSDIVVALRKMSLDQVAKQPLPSALFSAVKIEDLALLPENLSRDALRLQLTARNIEIDINAGVGIFEAASKAGTSAKNVMETAAGRARLRSLTNTMERCAQDSAELVHKLKRFEQAEFPQPLRKRAHELWRSFREKFTASEFHDEPIHFNDAMSLREVGDWVNWKEEQRLLPTFRVQDFLRAALQDPTAAVQVVSQSVGTINAIAHCETNGKHYCVRVRVNQDIFQYEHGLVKEAFVALALRDARTSAFSDAQLAKVYEKVASADGSIGSIDFPIGPRLYFITACCQIPDRPFPAIVSDWIDEQPLGKSNDPIREFEALGAAIRQLHEVKTNFYYRNLRDLGEYRFRRDFGADVVAEIVKRNDDVQVLKRGFDRGLLKMSDALGKIQSYSLCHNDLHCNNIFVSTASEKPIVIVDWDNACISHPYLDFVKLRYWSRIGEDGRFRGDASYFAAFCKGYGVNAGEVEQSPIFVSLSVLWLFRIILFEKRREAEGRGIPRPFQSSAYYCPQLLEAFGRL